MMRGVLVWVAAGAVAGLALGLADGLVLALSAREMFFDAGELWRTGLAAAGVCAGIGALLAVPVGTLAETLRFLAEPGRLLGGRWSLELVLTALFAAPLDAALWLSTSGPQASQLPLRPLLVGIVAFLIGAAAAVAIVRIAHWPGRRTNRRLAVMGGALLLAAVLVFVDLTVLVRLYPVFHLGLTLAALLLLSGSLRLMFYLRPGRAVLVGAGALALVALVGGTLALGWIRGSQNPRFVVSERTVSAADVVTVARAIAPPPRQHLLDELDTAITEPLPRAHRDGPAISRPGSPVFLITVDAMRHDRLIPGDPGKRRRVSPNLDALAARSVVFERAYTPIPHTSYAITSILTGKYARPLFDVPGAPRVHETWPEIMRRFRYETGGFFTKAVVFIDRSRFEPYLRKRFGFGTAQMDYRIPAAERVAQTIEFLDATRAAGHGNQVFAWTHFFEPHEPYDPECLRFGEEDVDRYDCEIAGVDLAIGELLAHIEKHYPQAIIIASSDHGEEFGDHGGRYHGTTLYDEQVRVPLVIHVPGVAPRRVTEPVNLVDLLGTTLALLDIPIPARVRSRDLTGLMVGRDRGPTETLCQVHERVMVVREDHKLICDREAGVCRLYDLENDPGEQRSVAELHPERVAELEARIRAWERSHAQVELRPVEEQGRAEGWPEPVRRALAGDESAALELLEVIRGEAPEPVRHKAAELVAEIWGERPPGPLREVDTRDDPVVAAWILLARHRAGEDFGVSKTPKVQAELEPMAKPWRALALTRLERGDTDALDDACRIAGDETVPHPERWQAVDLLSRTGDRRAAEALVPLIADYQLTLDAAAALAQLKHRAAVPVLIARLKRERFPERRAAVARALARIGDRQAIPAMAGELAREEPAADALGALVAIGAATARGKQVRAEPEAAEITVWSPVADQPIAPKHGAPSRLFLLTSAKADGGTVVVSCGGGGQWRLPVFAGEQSGWTAIDGCGAGEGIGIALEPADIEATIEAAALVVMTQN